MKYEIRLQNCMRTHPAYQEIRDRHYIPNNGSVGQQIHYLIFLDKEIIGIISGGSAAYAVKSRDDYFGITKENRKIALNGIVDNTVFRIEKNLPNLGTQILAMWRRQIAQDWELKYGVQICGFETFIIENDTRKGSMYKADNWDFVGYTSGSTKFHLHGAEKKFERKETQQKLVFCKQIKGRQLPTEYFSVWNKPNVIRNQISLFDE